MLSAFQCDIIAGQNEHGELLCYECATDGMNEVQRSMYFDEGRPTGDVTPLIRYSVDEYGGYEAENELDYWLHYADEAEIVARLRDYDVSEGDLDELTRLLAVGDADAATGLVSDLFWDYVAPQLPVLCEGCGEAIS